MAIPPDRNMHSDKGSPSTSEGRKNSKPIMEKRRRARINASLSELKSLLLEVIKKEGSRHSKMEKADILEMTVKHLRQLQRQQFTGSPKTDTNVLNNYRLGFEECAQEVTRYLSQMEICDVELRSRILNHLASSVSSGIFNPSPPTTPVSVVSPTVSSQPSTSSPSLPLPLPPVLALPSMYNPVLQEQPSNVLETYTSMASASPTVSQPVQMTKVVSGVQLIPTKLQSGEIALVLPSNVINSGGQVPSYIIPVYPQQTTEIQPQHSIASTTISAPTIISQMPVLQVTPPPLPILTKPTETAHQHHFVSPPSNQPILTLPSPNQFRSIPLFTPRPSQPPSSTITSQRLLDPRPLPLPNNLPPDPIGNPIRPDLPRDDSMWRPW